MKDETFNPNKPLRNRKHEKFCQELVKRPQDTQTLIYKELYPNVSEEQSRSAASQLSTNINIRERVMSLLTKDKAGLKDVSSVMSKHLHGDNAPVSADMCKTILRVAGALDEQKASDQSFHPTQINIIIRKVEDNA